MKVNKLTLSSPLFQNYLAHLADPPKQLFYAGELTGVEDRPKVAIVGSRKVSPYGRAVTEKIASELAKGGAVIISGLALGVDSLAHKATLQAGGTAIAVLPSGVDTIYPAAHVGLARQIIDRGGALISEYPNGSLPQKYQFIARNRLIAGLADVVILTEAADKSGSLHTANFALEQGKTVMAVPGNITSPNSVGTNNLIKAGAMPVTEAGDVWHALGVEPTQQSTTFAENPEEAVVLQLLQAGVTDTAELLEKSRLDPSVFNQTLTMLEISGKIRSHGSGQWTL
jgi:DNA processing protein